MKPTFTYLKYIKVERGRSYFIDAKLHCPCGNTITHEKLYLNLLVAILNCQNCKKSWLIKTIPTIQVEIFEWE